MSKLSNLKPISDAEVANRIERLIIMEALQEDLANPVGLVRARHGMRSTQEADVILRSWAWGYNMFDYGEIKWLCGIKSGTALGRLVRKRNNQPVMNAVEVDEEQYEKLNKRFNMLSNNSKSVISFHYLVLCGRPVKSLFPKDENGNSIPDENGNSANKYFNSLRDARKEFMTRAR